MPDSRTSAAPGRADGWERWRSLAGGVLFAGWVLALLAAMRTADDAREVTLDLLVLVLGLAAAASMSMGPLRLVHRRLRHAERRIAAMTSSEVLPWETDRHGRLTYVGEQVQEQFGWTPDEVIGKNLSEIVHPLELERLSAYLVAGTGWTNERWRCLVSDGTERWFAGSAVPNLGEDGRLVGFVGSVHPLGKDAVDQHRLSQIAEEVYDRLHRDDLVPVFQPILSVTTGRLMGAEALTRFPGSDLTPDRWFAQAEEVGLGVELELRAVERALQAAQSLPEDLYLSLNVSPGTLVRAELMERLLTGGVATDRVVLEVTEHASIGDYDAVLAASAALRAVGCRIAVDDAGAGYASFRHILRLAPEVIKLDRSLIAGLHQDPGLRALASAVVAFGREMGATVTAEGVETPEELRCAQDLGIHAAQGYLFGRPTAEWGTWREWHARGAVYSVAAAHHG